MNRLISVIVIFTFLSCSYGQDSSQIDITCTDFLIGLSDKDYIRTELLENGFSFKGQVENGERWELGDSYTRSIQLSIIDYDFGDIKFLEIWFNVDDEKIPNFSNTLKKDIKEMPIRKISKGYNIEGEFINLDEVADYSLYYFDENETIQVHFEDWKLDENKTSFYFRKPPVPLDYSSTYKQKQ